MVGFNSKPFITSFPVFHDIIFVGRRNWFKSFASTSGYRMHCMALSMAISRSLVDLERSQDRLLFWRSVKRCLLAAQVQLIVNDYGKQDDRALLPRSYMFYFCLKFLGALAGWKSLSSLRHVSRREETAWQEDFVQHGRSWECFRSKCKVIVGHLDFLSIAHLRS